MMPTWKVRSGQMWGTKFYLCWICDINNLQYQIWFLHEALNVYEPMPEDSQPHDGCVGAQGWSSNIPAGWWAKDL